MLKRISTWIIVVLSFTIAGFLFIVVRAKESGDIPQIRYHASKSLSLCSWPEVSKMHNADLINQFPYDLYLDSADYWNINDIKKDISCLDQHFDSSQNRVTISTALTNKLVPRLRNYFDSYKPDSLIVLLQWAEKFKSYAELEPINQLLYESIYDFWMDTLSNRITFFSNEKPSRKFDFKFRYLRTRCVEQRVSPSEKTSSEEKVFDNFIYSRWGHLFNASWNQTSLTQKVIFFLFIGLTICSYIVFIIWGIKKIRKK